MPMRSCLCLSLLLSACYPVPTTPVVTPTPSVSPSASPLPSPSPSPLPTPAPSLSPNAVRVSAVSVSPTLEISLTFSAGVTPESVRQGFSIHVLKDQKLSWQTNDKPLYETLRGEPVSSSADIQELPLLLTGSDFDLSWNDAHTEFLLIPKLNSQGERVFALPTDQNPAAAPTYAVSFCAQGHKHSLQTASGTSVSSQWFYVTNQLQDYHAFQVKPSSSFSRIKKIDKSENSIDVSFSTPIAQTTPWGIVSTGNPLLNSRTAGSILNPNHYKLSLYYLLNGFVYSWGSIDRDAEGTIIWPQAGAVHLTEQEQQPWVNIYTVHLVPPKNLDLTPLLKKVSSVEVEIQGVIVGATHTSVKSGDRLQQRFLN